jgi:tetratricopeptide (TPR) repeat protein
MSDPIYERYKEALKAGHVAALRGRLDDALVHYRQAAAIADERALPHASMGGVLLRMGRIDESIAAFHRALGRSPRDEQSLGGLADSLVAAGRSGEAADALERLAEATQHAGRGAEALVLLRRALALNATDRRRRHARAVERAVHQERAGAFDAAAALSAGVEAPEGGVVGHSPAAERMATGSPAPTRVVPGDGERELARAQLLAVDDEAGAVAAYLDAAAAYLLADAPAAAEDACQRALVLAPASTEVHLAFVRLWLVSGGRDLAADKLALLGQLLDLDGGPGVRERVLAVARESFPDDPRFARSA